MITVSIIITNFNYSEFLDRSIRSAFTQDFPQDKYEIIVIDDASTDRSTEIINSYGHLIRPIYMQENGGLSRARNKGLAEAQGEYIIFLDADDYLNREIIMIEALFLDFNEDVDAVACDYFLVDKEENVIDKKSCIENPIACGIMFRKNKIVDIGMYDETFRMWEEKDLQVRFSKKYKIGHIGIPLYRYRRHNMNMTNDKDISREYMKKLEEKHK
jgi:glycosyltransferase involved in cell wall biosynthesis